MKLTTTYRILTIAILLLVSVFGVQAQDNVVVNSIHKLSVKNFDDSREYYWEVLDEDKNPLSFVEIDGVYEISPLGTISKIQQTNGDGIKVKWSVEIGKDYTVFFTEKNKNDCQNTAEKIIRVIASPLSVSFKDASYYKCADEATTGITTTLVFAKTGEGDIDINKSLPFTVTFSCKYNTNATPLTITKEITDFNDLNLVVNYETDLSGLEGFSGETQENDHYLVFEITEAKDRFGAKVNIEGIKKYIYGAYVKPPVTKINNK